MPQSRSHALTAALLAPAAVFFIFLLIVPLMVVLVFSFGVRAPAGGYQAGFTFDNYLNLAARGKAFTNTLTLAPLATLITAVFAFPMAYFLALKVNPKYRVALLVLVMAPFWTSQLLRYYAWIMLLGAKGIPSWLAWIGITDVRIINTPTAVLIGAVYGFLPLMVPPIYVSLEKLDSRHDAGRPVPSRGRYAGRPAGQDCRRSVRCRDLAQHRGGLLLSRQQLRAGR